MYSLSYFTLWEGQQESGREEGGTQWGLEAGRENHVAMYLQKCIEIYAS